MSAAAIWRTRPGSKDAPQASGAGKIVAFQAAKPVRHSSCAIAGMPNLLAATIRRCSPARASAPAAGGTGRVPNTRVSWPMPSRNRSSTGSLVIQLPISLGLALRLNRRVRGRTFLRLAVFAPFVLSEATAAVMWYELLQPGGPLDALLKAAGLGGLVHYWLASTSLVLYTVFVVATWKYIGFGIVLLLAGLQGVPPELREAAAIDGATPWQATRAITLPLLGPTIRIWIFLSVIGSLQLFDLVLDHDPGRTRERVEHHADLPVHQRCPARCSCCCSRSA